MSASGFGYVVRLGLVFGQECVSVWFGLVVASGTGSARRSLHSVVDEHLGRGPGRIGGSIISERNVRGLE
jgi:hypothetical protein